MIKYRRNLIMYKDVETNMEVDIGLLSVFDCFFQFLFGYMGLMQNWKECNRNSQKSISYFCSTVYIPATVSFHFKKNFFILFYSWNLIWCWRWFENMKSNKWIVHIKMLRWSKKRVLSRLLQYYMNFSCSLKSIA